MATLERTVPAGGQSYSLNGVGTLLTNNSASPIIWEGVTVPPSGSVSLNGDRYVSILTTESASVTITYSADPVVSDPSTSTPGEWEEIADRLSLSRPPGPGDNTSKGYAVGSLWQYGGQIWTCVSATASSATWQRTQAGALPGDVMGAAAVFLGGTVALKSGFVGPAIDIVTIVASSPVTTTINILAGGELDNAAVKKALWAADPNTLTHVSKVYDQSGSGNDAEEATGTYEALLLDWDFVLDRYVITSAYDPNTSPGNARALRIDGASSAMPITGNAVGMFSFGRTLSSAGAGQLIFGTLGNAGGTANLFTLQTSNTGSIGKWTTAQSTRAPSAVVAPECGPCVVGVVCDAAASTFMCNESIGVNAVAPTVQVYDGGWLGTDRVSTRVNAMRNLGWAISNTALTATQQAAIRKGMYVLMDIRPQVLDTIAVIGDSRVLGTKTQVGGTLGTLISEIVGRSAKVYAFGTGSQTALAMATAPIPTVVGMYKAGAKNVAIMGPAGVNDFIGGATVEATQAALAADCQLLKNAGWKTILVAELAATTTTNGTNSKLPLLRAGILAAGTAGMNCDKILDLSGRIEVMSPSNATYVPDGLHPGTLLNGLIASDMVDAATEYLAS